MTSLVTPEIRRMFKSKETEGLVDETHNSILSSYLINLRLMPGKFTLLDLFADPDTGGVFRGVNHQILKSFLLNCDEVHWQKLDLGLNLSRISILEARRKFIQTLTKDEIDLLNDPLISNKDFYLLSQQATTPSVALAFKYFWILRHEYPEKDPKAPPFRGILPSTAPVVDVIRHYWPRTRKDLASLSELQHKLAKELGMEPNYVNTVLWQNGQSGSYLL